MMTDPTRGVDLSDAGLREQEARDLAAHVVIEAGLGREAWPIVMLALDAARAEWEGRAASLADTINQELRENGPLGVYQVDTNDDMREAVRLLVDYVRESATHAARAEMAQEIRAVSDGQLTYCGGEGETPCKRGSCWGCDVARILDAAIRAQGEATRRRGRGVQG